MKIALVTDKFSTGGGLEHIYQLCKGMGDIEFGVFAYDGEGKEKFKELSNVQLFTDGYDKKNIMMFHPDIVHIHHIKPLMKLYNIKIKTIFTVHGIHLHKYEFAKGLKSKFLRILRLNLEKYLYKRVDQVIVVSDDDQAYLKRYYRVDSKVVYNGIDYSPIDKIKASKKELRAELSLPLDKEIFLTVARFDFPKGYDILIEAIRMLNEKQDLKNKLFVFVGDGELFQEMKNLVYKYRLDEFILFMGTRNDVYKIMKASDCFVLPSRWEGFPITLIEAMACNLAIIASNTDGNRTVYNIEKRIILFNNLDYIDLAEKFICLKQNIYNNTFAANKMIVGVNEIYENK